jgi:hypothetical protein
VRTGDVLGLVGNSSSPYPHLHFQVTDGPGPMISDGVPFVLDAFVRNGKRVTDQVGTRV